MGLQDQFLSTEIGPIAGTHNLKNLTRALSLLTIKPRGDCSGPSVGALIAAAKASSLGSSLYLFTDTPPSDERRGVEAEAVLQERGLRVSYIITPGNCSAQWEEGQYCIGRGEGRTDFGARSEEYCEERMDLYHMLSEISGGQILFLRSSADIASLAPVLAFGAHNVLVTLLQRKTPAGFHDNITFVVDRSIDMVMVSVSGQETVNASISPPSGELE